VGCLKSFAAFRLGERSPTSTVRLRLPKPLVVPRSSTMLAAASRRRPPAVCPLFSLSLTSASLSTSRSSGRALLPRAGAVASASAFASLCSLAISPSPFYFSLSLFPSFSSLFPLSLVRSTDHGGEDDQRRATAIQYGHLTTSLSLMGRRHVAPEGPRGSHCPPLSLSIFLRTPSPQKPKGGGERVHRIGAWAHHTVLVSLDH
jgi:hypothetical protein